MPCNIGKTDGETKESNIVFSKNVFDLNQKHLQVFQTFHFLKNTKETNSETQKS